jgi:hypothetical protein
MRNKKYRALWEAETRDSDGDGIPDCYMADAAREKAALEGHKPETNPFKDR